MTDERKRDLLAAAASADVAAGTMLLIAGTLRMAATAGDEAGLAQMIGKLAPADIKDVIDIVCEVAVGERGLE